MATTTLIVMITDALKEIRVLGEGESPTAEQAEDARRMMNRILDTLSNLPPFAYVEDQVQIALSGQTSFDIGPTGDIVADRPLKIQSAIATLGGIDYPDISIISAEEYDSIGLKTATGSVPEYLFYDGEFPDGNVYVYPVCNGCTLKMRTLSVVKQFSALTTQIEMPPGYEDFLTLKLAIRLAPGYAKTPSPDTKLACKAAEKAIFNTNLVVPKLSIDVPVSNVRGSGYPAILAG